LQLIQRRREALMQSRHTRLQGHEAEIRARFLRASRAFLLPADDATACHPVHGRDRAPLRPASPQTS
jgi:hypothetical protein